MFFIFSLVLLVASFAIEALTAKKATSVKPASITDFTVPQSAEGTPQSVVFGDVWTSDYQVLWYGNLSNQPIYASSAKK